MALEHRHSHTVRSNAGSVTAASYTITGTHEFNLELVDKAIGTDTAQDAVWDVSQIVSLAIEADTAMTLETNSSSSPANTISLTANTPLIWDTTILATTGAANPLTTDVTSLFITNAAIGDLSIYILFNGS
jgi:hypothetical protein